MKRQARGALGDGAPDMAGAEEQDGKRIGFDGLDEASAGSRERASRPYRSPAKAGAQI
jgi:hypothetical protein